MKKKKVLALVSIVSVIFSSILLNAAEPNTALGETTSKGYVLMETGSGEILLENNSEEKMPPASITKVMTLLLIYEAVDSGKISWDEKVTISEHSAGMGGSQAYMEFGEEQTVRDLVKCIAIASANDAAVAMAERIAGSEEQFVEMMNQRATELGMQNTTFKNACGLHTEGHVSTAKDIAMMSRELMAKYPDITQTLTIWMDTIIHKTRRGESEFGLTNTNKMIKWYDGITGLKTGYTPEAKHCVSAMATREDLSLVAVVLGAADSKARFREAGKLLDYGFANFNVKKGPSVGTILEQAAVKKGAQETVSLTLEESITFVVSKNDTEGEITYEIIPDEVYAPIYKGQKMGEIKYYLKGELIGSGEVVAADDVEKAKLKDMIPYACKRFFRFKK